MILVATLYNSSLAPQLSGPPHQESCEECQDQLMVDSTLTEWMGGWSVPNVPSSTADRVASARRFPLTESKRRSPLSAVVPYAYGVAAVLASLYLLSAVPWPAIELPAVIWAPAAMLFGSTLTRMKYAWEHWF